MTAYSSLNSLVQSQIQILKEEPYLENREVNSLIHYQKRTIDKAMKKIIAENLDYDIRYTVEINCVSLVIQQQK